jgi:primosomal protein N' (replication factor Y) (superfamily II helicase)
VCVLNTTGRSGRLACAACASMIVCETCAALVAQHVDHVLRCTRCATVRPPICQTCGGLRLKSLRTGVTRLRDEFEMAAGRPVSEVTASRVHDLETPLADVVVGTEAALHRVDSADVVAFVDIDQELLAPRMRAEEQAMGLIVLGARLLGRRSLGGRMLIQTRLADHPVVCAALRADPTLVSGSAIETRRMLGFR